MKMPAHIPFTLGDSPYASNVTLSFVTNGREYTYNIPRASMDMQSSSIFEDHSSWRSDYPIRTTSSFQTSLTLNILEPNWNLSYKEIKRVSIKHTMTMEVRGAVTTEDIASFTHQLPKNATWKVNTEKRPFGDTVNIFSAEWAVDSKPVVVENINDDEDDDDYERSEW